MKHRLTLTITSLLSAVLFTLHWADEIARGMEPGTIDAFGGFVILFVWLYATLVHIERRSGLAIVLLGAILASGVPVLHMRGAAGLLSPRILSSGRVLFWVWTNIALGASGMISVALSAHALWGLRRT